jgi:hypothetical protein
MTNAEFHQTTLSVSDFVVLFVVKKQIAVSTTKDTNCTKGFTHHRDCDFSSLSFLSWLTANRRLPPDDITAHSFPKPWQRIRIPGN